MAGEVSLASLFSREESDGEGAARVDFFRALPARNGFGLVMDVA